VPDIFPSSIKILIMENGNFIEKLASQFGQSASVKNVYGDPIQAGDKTIIPVAQIAFGLGGGYGQGNKRKRPTTSADNTNMALNEKEDNMGNGAGGGGGLYARPKGVYEITANSTRFIPANSTRQILMGMAIGFLVKAWLFKK